MSSRSSPRWSSPEAVEIAASLSMADPEAAVRQHARNVLATLATKSVPVRLPELFEWASVRRVRTEAMLLEGGLKRNPSGLFDIVVRADRPPRRQRFSAAHELGHILFYKFAPESKKAQELRGRNASDEEERLCNVAAEEFLMPIWHIERLQSQHCEPITMAIDLSTQCDVSITSAMIRAASFLRGQGQLQLWDVRDSTWQCTHRVRFGRSRLRLDDFQVEVWKGHAMAPSLPWRSEGWLYSTSSRHRVLARTTVARVPGRTSVLVSHELLMTAPKKVDALEAARRDQVRQAQRSAAAPGCKLCRGTGWIEDFESHPGDRLRPVRICACRYGSTQESA